MSLDPTGHIELAQYLLDLCRWSLPRGVPLGTGTGERARGWGVGGEGDHTGVSRSVLIRKALSKTGHWNGDSENGWRVRVTRMYVEYSRKPVKISVAGSEVFVIHTGRG